MTSVRASQNMNIFYQLIKGIAYVFAWPCSICVIGLMSIFFPSSDQKWVRSSRLPLIPLGLVLLVPAFFFFVISSACFMLGYHGLAVRGELQEGGIWLADRAHHIRRLLAWADIKEFKCIHSTPRHTFSAVLRSGEEITVHEIDEEPLARVLDQRGIPFTNRIRWVDCGLK
jgi:hypothetical protein